MSGVMMYLAMAEIPTNPNRLLKIMSTATMIPIHITLPQP